METRYTGESTLDEPVSKTIVGFASKDESCIAKDCFPVQMRDLLSIYSKLLQVLYPPKQGGTNELLRYVRSWSSVVRG
jgi:hypothetical protein